MANLSLTQREDGDGELYLSDTEFSYAVSESTSVIHDHEPFQTFQLRVYAFARTMWPNVDPEKIFIERLEGGGYNRIIGITIYPTGTKGQQYILRIPRFDATRVGRDVAAFIFARFHTILQVPKVITFDTRDNNPLQYRYMLYNRIPGTSMLASFPSLSHDKKCKVARELGGIVRQLLNTNSKDTGYLILPPDQTESNLPLHVVPFLTLSEKESEVAAPYCSSSSNMKTVDLLKQLFQTQREEVVHQKHLSNIELELLDDLCDMVSELGSGGWLDDIPTCLAHLDLVPRNILVGTNAADYLPIISGILDWDTAILAPSFMCCAPPRWLWTYWDGEGNEDERAANEEPSSKEARELKKLFEDAAGSDYVRLAYPNAYQLSRRLFRLASQGLRHIEDFRKAQELLVEWERFTKTET